MNESEKIVALENKIEELTGTIERLIQCQEEDYRTVSADLHDELGQSLTAVLLRLKMLQNESDPDKIRKSLFEVEDQVKDTLGDVRRFTRFLRPIILETMGLIPALEWFAENYEIQTGITTYFKYNADRIRFPRKLETHVYRILQEAMNNAYKHAGATMIAIGVSYQEDLFVISIRDNGCGFDMDQKSGGLGLAGMRMRAQFLNGTMSIQSSPGKGTHIYMSCVVKKKEKDTEKKKDE